MKVWVGNHKIPFSLEEMTSSKYQNFQERAFTDDIQWIPGRAEGIGVSFNGKNWNFSTAVHGEHVAVGDGDETDEGWGIAGRLTVAPVYDKKANHFVHTGISVRRWQKQGDNTSFVDFDDQPHSHQTTVNFLNTGAIAFVDNYTVVGPELAFGYGPFGMQAEYFQIDVNRETNDDLDFSASYVEGWYYLTGEGRSYKPKKGTFGRIKPKKNLSDGGLAVNISESLVHSKQGLGVRLDIERKLENNELLFGECQSVIVVSLEEPALYELILLAQKLDMYTQTIGRITDTGNLVINDYIDISRKKLGNAYFNSLEKIMVK